MVTSILRSWEYNDEALKKNVGIIRNMYKKRLFQDRRIPSVDDICAMIESYNLGAIANDMQTDDREVIEKVYEEFEESSAFALMDEFVIQTLNSMKLSFIDRTFSAIEEGILSHSPEAERGFMVYNDAQNALFPEFISNGLLSQGLFFNVVKQKERLAIGA